jgi:hypothetical protein
MNRIVHRADREGLVLPPSASESPEDANVIPPSAVSSSCAHAPVDLRRRFVGAYGASQLRQPPLEVTWDEVDNKGFPESGMVAGAFALADVRVSCITLFAAPFGTDTPPSQLRWLTRTAVRRHPFHSQPFLYGCSPSTGVRYEHSP